MQSHTQRVQMTARSLILRRQSKNYLDISFCWNVAHSIVWQLTWGGRENQNSLWMVPNILYSSEQHVNHVTLMQLSVWWKAVVCAGCPRLCNSTVKYVLTGGVRVVGNSRLRVCVSASGFLSQSLSPHVLSLHWPSPLTCPVASRLQASSSCVLFFNLMSFYFTFTFFSITSNNKYYDHIIHLREPGRPYLLYFMRRLIAFNKCKLINRIQISM